MLMGSCCARVTSWPTLATVPRGGSRLSCPQECTKCPVHAEQLGPRPPKWPNEVSQHLLPLSHWRANHRLKRTPLVNAGQKPEEERGTAGHLPLIPGSSKKLHAGILHAS